MCKIGKHPCCKPLSNNLSMCAWLKEDQPEGIAHHLLNDNHVTTDSNEISLMSRVNSLCCLLQKGPIEMLNSHDNSHDSKGSLEGPNDKNIQLGHDLESMQGNKTKIDMKAAESDFKLQQNLHNRHGKYRCRNSLESPKFDYDPSHQLHQCTTNNRREVVATTNTHISLHQKRPIFA